MIPVRALLFSHLLRRAWRVGLVALLIATLMEWGLCTKEVPAELS
jgi:hypothetical protein